MASGIEQKLIQRLTEARMRNAVEASRLPSDGQDLKFEFGRRVGYVQGMDYTIAQVIKFFTEAEKDDEDL